MDVWAAITPPTPVQMAASSSTINRGDDEPSLRVIVQPTRTIEAKVVPREKNRNAFIKFKHEEAFDVRASNTACHERVVPYVDRIQIEELNMPIYYCYQSRLSFVKRKI